MLSLSPREFYPNFTLNGLYVLASRVRTSGGLFILEAVKDWKHLRALRHPPELEIWESAYSDKVFDVEAASKAAERVAKRFQEQKDEAGKRAKAEKSAKAKAQRRAGTTKQEAGAKRKASSSKLTTVGNAAKDSASKVPNAVCSAVRCKRKGVDGPAGAPKVNHSRGGGASTATCPAWAISTPWHNNSCAYDAGTQALHLGYCAAAEWKGHVGRYQAPPMPARRQPHHGNAVAPSDVGAAMRRWMEVQEAVTRCTETQREAHRERLTRARNGLRDAYLRSKIFRADQPRRNANATTEVQIAARVCSQRGNFQAVADVLRQVVRFEEGAPLVAGPPDFLGGGWGGVQCRSCGNEARDQPNADCRVHEVLPRELGAAFGDPIAALRLELFSEADVRGVGTLRQLWQQLLEAAELVHGGMHRA